MRQSFLPGFEVDLSFVLVDVEMTEDPAIRLIGRLVDGSAGELAIGMPVQTEFEDLSPGLAVPAFTRAPTR